jgi:hypothetical protein
MHLAAPVKPVAQLLLRGSLVFLFSFQHWEEEEETVPPSWCISHYTDLKRYHPEHVWQIHRCTPNSTETKSGFKVDE